MNTLPSTFKPSILLYILICICTCISNVNALNYTVSNGNDTGPGSLRQAFHDVITNPGPDVIDINSVSLIVLSTYNDPFTFVNLPSISDVTINGNNVTILSTTGSYFAQIRSNSILNDINFSGFTHGCLHLAGPGSITLNTCTFSGCTNFNHFIPFGGAVLLLSGMLSVIDCEFTNCQARTGGAVATIPGGSGLHVDGCTFNNNIATQAPFFGNAVFLSEANFTTTLTNLITFSGVVDQDIYSICAENPTGCQINLMPPFSHIGPLVIR